MSFSNMPALTSIAAVHTQGCCDYRSNLAVGTGEGL